MSAGTRTHDGTVYAVQDSPVDLDEHVSEVDGWVYGWAPPARIGSSGLNRLPVCWQVHEPASSFTPTAKVLRFRIGADARVAKRDADELRRLADALEHEHDDLDLDSLLDDEVLAETFARFEEIRARLNASTHPSERDDFRLDRIARRILVTGDCRWHAAHVARFHALRCSCAPCMARDEANGIGR